MCCRNCSIYWSCLSQWIWQIAAKDHLSGYAQTDAGQNHPCDRAWNQPQQDRDSVRSYVSPSDLWHSVVYRHRGRAVSWKVCELLEQIQDGNRRPIFSISWYADIESELDKPGMSPLICILTQKPRERQTWQPAFNDGQRSAAFLISLVSWRCLSQSDLVQTQLSWSISGNPAVEAQAIGRAHRIGQPQCRSLSKWLRGYDWGEDTGVAGAQSGFDYLPRRSINPVSLWRKLRNSGFLAEYWKIAE